MPASDRPVFRLKEAGRSNARLARLNRELGLPSYDLLLVGDGSGTGGWQSDIGLGWACVCVEMSSGRRDLVSGAWSVGPIEVAELMAYFHSLLAFDRRRGDALKQKLKRPVSVLVLTDNQVIVDQSRTQLLSSSVSADKCNRSTSPIWAGVRDIAKSGYVLTFKHIPRLSIRLNQICDLQAGASRKALIGTVTEWPDEGRLLSANKD